MGYRIDGKDVDLSGIRKLSFVPKEKAGDVYRYKNTALRIFKDGEEPIDQETAEYLTNIHTERILLPKKLLFYNNVFKGYSMKLVPQKGSGQRMIAAPKDELIGSVIALEKDVDKISQKKVLLNGANPGYVLYNGELYLVNPAGYSILELEKSEDLKRLNAYQIHLLLIELIASDLRKSHYPQKTINVMKKLLSMRDLDQPSSSYLNELMKDKENIKELVKKMS